MKNPKKIKKLALNAQMCPKKNYKKLKIVIYMAFLKIKHLNKQTPFTDVNAHISKREQTNINPSFFIVLLKYMLLLVWLRYG